MTKTLNQIVKNAQHGCGSCAGCPVQQETQGQNVNPGLLNYDAEVMFLTLDPSHAIEWDSYESWDEYNQDYRHRFASWRGGRKIRQIVASAGLTLEDVWIGDSIKCPVENSLNEFESQSTVRRAFDHCSEYLVNEVEQVDPAVIVTLGAEPAQRLLPTVFDVEIGPLKPGTRDCSKIIRTTPPVVISPHWSHGWLDRSPSGVRNLTRVKEAFAEAHTDSAGEKPISV